MSTTYAAETAGSIMTIAIPTCRPESTREAVLHELSAIAWEDVHQVFVIDKNNKLLGHVRFPDLVKHPRHTPIQDIIEPTAATISPHADQERAVFLAVKNDLDTVPVVDADGRLLGAVTAKSIIDVMHDEHVEDALMATGIRRGRQGVDMVKLTSARLVPVIGTRAPWLIVGAIMGMVLGFVASLFEEQLGRTVALAYFIPVVAFIADSVGAQSVAITVRALAMLKLNYGRYLLRELAIGLTLGVILGVFGAVGALVVSRSADIAVVVGISLLAASTVASALAALVPFFFKKIGKDPALASGPLATAIQDILSIVIYFLVALAIIG